MSGKFKINQKKWQQDTSITGLTQCFFNWGNGGKLVGKKIFDAFLVVVKPLLLVHEEVGRQYFTTLYYIILHCTTLCNLTQYYT